jgi:hypothetical protein
MEGDLAGPMPGDASLAIVLAASALIAALLATPTHASDCYSIKDSDQRNACLAGTK